MLSPTASSPLVFDPFSREFFDDPYPIYRRLRDQAPVYADDTYGFYALSRHEDVAAAFRDHETYSSARGIELSQVTTNAPVPKQLIMMDPPEHRRMRSLVNKVFTPRAITALEPMVREVVGRHLDALDLSDFDVVHDFAELFPVEIITRMLGVPESHRQRVREWLDVAMRREVGRMHPSREGIKAMVETGAMYWQLIQERRAAPQDDMISALIAAEVEREDGTKTSLDDEEIAGFATLLGGGGAETVTKLIGNAMVLFFDNPREWEKLQTDRSKVPAAVEELLRIEAPSQYVVRASTREVTLHGVTIPPGSPVMLLTGSANRDERAFPDPDRFDIDRDRGQALNIGFGYGVHSCLGAALARMESAIALGELLDRLPRYTVDRSRLERFAMANVAGWSRVPVRALP